MEQRNKVNNGNHNGNNLDGTNLGHNVRHLIEQTPTTANARIHSGTSPTSSSNGNCNRNRDHYNYNPDHNSNDNGQHHLTSTINGATIVATKSSTHVAAPTATTQEKCNCPESTTTPNGDADPNQLVAELRAKALANTPPHIIECSCGR